MGFSLQEAQWLVKFYQSLPGRVRAVTDAQPEDAQHMQSQYADHGGGDYGYSDYQAAGYYDDYR